MSTEVKVISHSKHRLGMVEAVVLTSHKAKRFKQGKMKTVTIKQSRTVHVDKDGLTELKKKEAV